MTTRLDSFLPQLLADPYPLYRLLRESQPVAFVEELGLWLVTRYEEVRRVLTDPVFSSDFRYARSGIIDPVLDAELEALAQATSQDMLRCDPPDHTRRRGVVGRAFSPQVIKGLAPGPGGRAAGRGGDPGAHGPDPRPGPSAPRPRDRGAARAPA